MRPAAEAVESETAGSLLTERGRWIRHRHLQRYYRPIHPHIASTFGLVSAHETLFQIAVDGIVWTWSFVWTPVFPPSILAIYIP